jgi:hypothetical protein
VGPGTHPINGTGSKTDVIGVFMRLPGVRSLSANRGRLSAAAPRAEECKPPFNVTGAIKRVIVDLSGGHVEGCEAQLRIVLAKQ